MKRIVSIVLFSALGGALTLGAYKLFLEKPQFVMSQAATENPNMVQTSYSNTLNAGMENTDFTVAAEKTLNSVVHVKNTMNRIVQDPFAEFFYGQGNHARRSAGYFDDQLQNAGLSSCASRGRHALGR